MTDMTPKQIDAALEAGILSEEQAKAMRAKIARTVPEVGPETKSLIGNEEDMRFVRSFSDVFIAMGLGLFALGLSAFGGIMNTAIVFVALAVFMWLQAEYFARHKRAHLPTLIISLAYLVFVHAAAGKIGGDSGLALGVMPAFVTLGAMLAFYWRFRLPFSIALIAISLVILVFSFVHSFVPIGAFLMLSGMSLFAAALVYDSKDTGRLTRFSDNAFWLHFTAAPLLLHGIAIQILSLKTTKLFNLIPVPSLNTSDAVVFLIIIGVLAVVGVAVNRRALLVSSFGYAGFSLAMLIKTTGMGFGTMVAVTLLLLGGGIVFLGAGWHSARRALLKVLPRSGVFAKIFPPAP